MFQALFFFFLFSVCHWVEMAFLSCFYWFFWKSAIITWFHKKPVFFLSIILYYFILWPNIAPQSLLLAVKQISHFSYKTFSWNRKHCPATIYEQSFHLWLLWSLWYPLWPSAWDKPSLYFGAECLQGKLREETDNAFIKAKGTEGT